MAGPQTFESAREKKKGQKRRLRPAACCAGKPPRRDRVLRLRPSTNARPGRGMGQGRHRSGLTTGTARRACPGAVPRGPRPAGAGSRCRPGASFARRRRGQGEDCSGPIFGGREAAQLLAVRDVHIMPATFAWSGSRESAVPMQLLDL